MLPQTISEMLGAGQTQLCEGRVVDILTDGSVEVRLVSDQQGIEACDVLNPAAPESASLQSGDRVLVWIPLSHSERGCIVGKIGRLAAHNEESSAGSTERITAKTLEIRAEEKIVIGCGEGSLTIAKDGTIVIRGARILSRAKGVNKIKGGAVQIN